jgi:hypothetical protein
MTQQSSLSVSDQLELTALYARYTDAFDSGDAERFAALFTEDGAFDRDGAEPVRGRTALDALVRSAATGTPRRHLVSAIQLEPGQAGRASGSAYVTVLGCRDNALLLVTMGTYRDEFAHQDGCWRIQRRRFTAWLVPELAGTPLASAPLVAVPHPAVTSGDAP